MSANATFSKAVSSGSSMPCWKTKPNSSRRRRDSAASAKVSSRKGDEEVFKVMAPASGLKIPARQCSRVVLPEPDGPMIAMDSPAFAMKSTWSRAMLPGIVLGELLGVEDGVHISSIPAKAPSCGVSPLAELFGADSTRGMRPN
jgi:hypothetical protein